MDEKSVKEILKTTLKFSDKSIKKIDIFNDYLRRFNKKYNLISKKTEKIVWFRHILDSAQIVKFIDVHKFNDISDFGSGAGFPGIIIALFSENQKFHVKLYEKSRVKRGFLKEIISKLDINNIEVRNDIYEYKIKSNIIVCRAFKKLDEIIRISREILIKPHKIIILKGKNAQIEINNVSLDSNYSYKLVNSMTEANSKIILIDAK